MFGLMRPLLTRDLYVAGLPIFLIPHPVFRFLPLVCIPVFHLHIANSAALMTWRSPGTRLYPRAQIDSQLGPLRATPVVLVHHGQQHDAWESWVNNSANIDDTKILWADDVGSRKNEDLIGNVPDRAVWRFGQGQNEDQFTRSSLANNSANPKVVNTSQSGQAGLSCRMGVR